MENFTPGSALLGGAAIGLATALFLLTTGRVAGISGVSGGILFAPISDKGWRIVFVAGLIGGVLVYRIIFGLNPDITLDASLPVLIIGGLCVGFGTRLGGGCTSGHGVCGISRLSARSLAATVIFMLAAGVTVLVARPVVGG